MLRLRIAIRKRVCHVCHLRTKAVLTADSSMRCCWRRSSVGLTLCCGGHELTDMLNSFVHGWTFAVTSNDARLCWTGPATNVNFIFLCNIPICCGLEPTHLKRYLNDQVPALNRPAGMNPHPF